MKITDLVKAANALVTSDHYVDYCEQYPVPWNAQLLNPVMMVSVP